jgi:flagella synthesis protein FlgN
MAAVLDEEIRELRAFTKLLQQEQTLLTAGDTGESLLPLAQRKTEFTTRLEELSARREQLLVQRGKGAGRAGMDAWVSEASGAPLKARWQGWLASALEARTLNELNGKLIRMHLQHNQDALTVLMSAANRASVYGPDGHQIAAGAGRSLGKA